MSKKIKVWGSIIVEPIVANTLRVESNGIIFIIRDIGDQGKPEIRIELNDDVKYQLKSDRKDQVRLVKK